MNSVVLERVGGTIYRISATRQHCHECNAYTSCLFPHTAHSRAKTKYYCHICMGTSTKKALVDKPFKKKEGYELFLADAKTRRNIHLIEASTDFNYLIELAQTDPSDLPKEKTQ